jgi:hypothetical protein
VLLADAGSDRLIGVGVRPSTSGDEKRVHRRAGSLLMLEHALLQAAGYDSVSDRSLR